MERYMSNCDGEVEVLERSGEVCRIRFLNTNYERFANIQNVKAGKVRDHSIKDRRWEHSEEQLADQIYTNNSGNKLKIIARKGKTCTVLFLETGHTKTANIDNIKDGKIKDPYSKGCYGVGYDGVYNKNFYWKQAKQLWRNMLKRCYSPNDSRGYFGKGVSVDIRWHCFANFLEDLPKLENFHAWLKGKNENSIKYNLDKDIKIEGNKVYSMDTCMFVTESENKAAGAINARRYDKLKVGKD